MSLPELPTERKFHKSPLHIKKIYHPFVDKIVVKYCPGLLSEADVRALKESTEEMTLRADPIFEHTSRGDKHVYRFGNHKAYTTETILEYPQTKHAQGWITANQTIFDKLSAEVDHAEAFPEIANSYKKIPIQYRKFGLWSAAFLNINSPSAQHTDSGDFRKGLRAITAWGKFSGGDLVCPEAGYSFRLWPRDVMLMNAYHLTHYSQNWTGNRDSLVLTTHQTMFFYYQYE